MSPRLMPLLNVTRWELIINLERICKQQQRHFMMPPKPIEPKLNMVNKTYVPQLVFKYNRLHYYLSKLRMLKLRWKWDRHFRERRFVEDAKQAAIQLTENIRLHDMKKMDSFATSNVFYQMANESIHFPHKSCTELLRFREQDLRLAVPIKVQLQEVLGLRYASIDMAMLGMRHATDYDSADDLEKMKNALIEMEPELKEKLDDPNYQWPYVIIELFLRFRRNYSNAGQLDGQELINHTNRWLVSVYKICRLNIFTVPPST